VAAHPNFDMNRSMVLGDNQKQVTVTADQHAAGADLRLMPFAGIAGTVIDENGDPVEGCQMMALSAWSTKRAMRRAQWSAVTDDRGEYHLGNLPAGRYYIYERCQMTIGAAHGFMARSDPRTPNLAFVPEFYGGTPTLTGASPVLLRPGAEARGIDFQLKMVAAVHVMISVSATEPGADPRSVTVMLNPAEQQLWGYAGRYNPATGTFMTPPVTPGSYRIVAQSQQGPELYGQTTVDINGQTVPATAQLELDSPLSISGTVHVDSDQQAEGGGPLQIALQPVGEFYRSKSPMASVVGRDGGFAVGNVLPGRWRVQMMNTGEEVRSATFGDHEISPEGFEIPAGGGGPLNVVLTSKQVQLTVAVSGMDKARQAEIMAWAKDGDPTEGTMQRSFGVSAQGTATVTLPPGSYRIYAIESNSPWAIASDPALLHAIADRGKVVEAKDNAAGATSSLSLDLITRDDLRSALDREVQ
jgi:hypothetical protein